jgi:anti-anti-sigma regulatory factor
VDRAADHVWVVSAPGERDLADAEALGKAFDDVFRQGSMLVVDLSQTTFIDSRIIGTLMAAGAKTGSDTPHELIVVAPPGGHPRKVLDMTVRDKLRLFDDLPSALSEATS